MNGLSSLHETYRGYSLAVVELRIKQWGGGDNEAPKSRLRRRVDMMVHDRSGGEFPSFPGNSSTVY